MGCTHCRRSWWFMLKGMCLRFSHRLTAPVYLLTNKRRRLRTTASAADESKVARLASQKKQLQCLWLTRYVGGQSKHTKHACMS